MSKKMRLLEMLKEKAYRKGKFTLSSGKESEHYINCKPVTLDGEGLSLISTLLLPLLEWDTKAVAGLTLGADPLVSAVAMKSYEFWQTVNDGKIILSPVAVSSTGLIIRKEPKGHGTLSQIEGDLPPTGTKVTVLEDVVTTAGSSLKAVKVLRSVGYVVESVVAIVDRLEGGQEALEKEGVELKSLFTVEDF